MLHTGIPAGLFMHHNKVLAKIYVEILDLHTFLKERP